MQAGSIQPGQNVLVVDDLIATGEFLSRLCHRVVWYRPFCVGGSAKAAGELVAKLGGKTLEYLFIIELTFLKAAEKLDAPMYSIVKVDD